MRAIRRLGLRLRIGASVTAGRVTVVLADGGRIVRELSAPVGDGDTHGAIIGSLLRSLEATWLRSPLIVALGPSFTQLRLVTDEVAGSLSIRTEASRHLVLDPSSVLADPVPATRGRSAVAVFDGAIVHEIAQAVAESGHRVRAFVPLPLLLQAQNGAQHVEVGDGSVVMDIAFAGSTIDAVNRGFRSLHSASAAEVDMLAARTATWWGSQLAFRPGDHARKKRRDRFITSTAVLLAAGLTVLAFAAPAISAARAGERYAAEAVALEPQVRRSKSLMDTLAALRRARSAYAALASEQIGMTVFLRDLTAALPESTAVTSFRVDRKGGTVSFVAPSAMLVLRRLGAIEQAGTVSLASTITNESIEGAVLERATLRFFWKETAAR